MRAHRAIAIISTLWLFSCGGSGLPPDSAFSEANAAESTPAADKPADKAAADKPADKTSDADKPTDKASDSDDAAKSKKDSGPEPAFTENMSVEDAIKAASGTERMNIDQEELSKPLTDSSLYEPCKPGTAHFKLKVAIWRGKAVGIDLSTTPKNQKLTDCLKERIRSVTWSAKVPSLNTVSFTY
jgi:hypothetical protein